MPYAPPPTEPAEEPEDDDEEVAAATGVPAGGVEESHAEPPAEIAVGRDALGAAAEEAARE
eukprot:3740086-Prorocentrum_lima.AAC.1